MGSAIYRPWSGWRVSLFHDAGEASGSFRTQRLVIPNGLLPGGGPASGGAAEVAHRRATSKLRRYCAANSLNRLGTLTYAEACHDPRQVRSDVGRFFRRLRRGLGGEAFPYVWVPELHKSGHGWHLHFAVGRYVPRGVIEEAWGLGFVHIKLIGDLPVGSGARAEARAAARYLSKYLGKELSGSGLNRYDVAQGFQPKSEVYWATSADDAVERGSQRMRAAPVYVWRSINQEGWQGPPALWVIWR